MQCISCYPDFENNREGMILTRIIANYWLNISEPVLNLKKSIVRHCGGELRTVSNCGKSYVQSWYNKQWFCSSLLLCPFNKMFIILKSAKMCLKILQTTQGVFDWIRQTLWIAVFMSKIIRVIVLKAARLVSFAPLGHLSWERERWRDRVTDRGTEIETQSIKAWWRMWKHRRVFLHAFQTCDNCEEQRKYSRVFICWICIWVHTSVF